MTEMQFGYLVGCVAMGLVLVFGIWWFGHDAGVGMVLSAAISGGLGAAGGGAVTHWQHRLAKRQWRAR
jgi:hypothetical protein